MLPTAVATVTTILSLVGLGYYLLALWSARAFQHQLSRPLPDFQPGVSILKPVKGLDPEMYAKFRQPLLAAVSGTLRNPVRGQQHGRSGGDGN